MNAYPCINNAQAIDPKKISHHGLIIHKQEQVAEDRAVKAWQCRAGESDSGLLISRQSNGRATRKFRGAMVWLCGIFRARHQ